jgi:DNA-binding NarL/FixJ family response regulator
MSIRVVIVDDSAAIRKVVRSGIESHTTCQVIGEGADGKAAVELTQSLRPDVLVLDVSMPVMDGLDAAQEIAATTPSTTIILFTSHDSEPLLERAQNLGVKAVLSKSQRDALQRLTWLLQEITDEPSAA